MVSSTQNQQQKEKRNPPRIGAGMTQEQMIEVVRSVASGTPAEEALRQIIGGNDTGEAAVLNPPGAASSTMPKPAKSRTRKKGQYTAEEKQSALELVASGLKQRDIAKSVGVHEKTLSTWVCNARKNGEMPTAATETRNAQKNGEMPTAATETPVAAEAVSSSGEREDTDVNANVQTSSSNTPAKLYAPKDPGQGLAGHEREAILELKKKHPSYGPAQVRAQLKRFKGWRVSIKAIAKVFRDNGYELVHRGSRPEGPDPIRFEAPRRNAIWQIDFAEMRIVGEKLHLCVILDDFSRYVVGHVLAEHSSGEVAVELLQSAIARHGKPESVRSDRGGSFLGKEFTDALETELIDHIVGRSYHPQGGGKIESVMGTVRRELWDVEQFDDKEHALRRAREFFDDYNERRAHMGIDGLTPADRYFGRANQVLATINAVSRNRNGALSRIGGAFEELVPSSTQTPMEVLRLVLVDGKMELRFCGARVELGRVIGW